MNRFFLFLLFFLALPYSAHATQQPHELRVGVLRHDITKGLKHAYEEGYNLNVEYLAKSFDVRFWRLLFDPRIHLGASINLLMHGTHQFYTGLTWHAALNDLFFLELSFGGEIHNAPLKTKTVNQQALGTRVLFRESASFGFYIGDHYTFSLFVDHASNGAIVAPNPGLTSVGIRLGYRFTETAPAQPNGVVLPDAACENQ